MSFSDSQTDLRVLDPPEFGSRCTICGAWKGQLPWQIRTSDGWGFVCRMCGERLLLELLHTQLPSTFSKLDLMNVLFSVGLKGKEAELTAVDLEKERIILKDARGLFWHEESSAVIEPLVKQKPRHMFRRKTAQEIFGQCIKLSREIRGRPEFFRSRRPDEPIREPTDQGGQ